MEKLFASKTYTKLLIWKKTAWPARISG